MDRVDYQKLRFEVEMQLVDFDNSSLDRDAVLNSIMRSFLQAVSSSQVKRISTRRTLATFRRDSKSTPPGWAYRKPGTDSRLPTL